MIAKAISFTPEVLKAKLRVLQEFGRCQTRRPVVSNLRAHPVRRVGALMNDGTAWVEPGGWVKSPFGTKGSRLWIRERARVLKVRGPAERLLVLLGYDDGGKSEWLPYPSRLKPPVEGHCIPNGVHREGARHFLEVVGVRAERVTEISADDAVLEGINPSEAAGLGGDESLRQAYFALYDSIYGHGATARDWCWVYTLKRAKP